MDCHHRSTCDGVLRAWRGESARTRALFASTHARDGVLLLPVYIRWHYLQEAALPFDRRDAVVAFLRSWPWCRQKRAFHQRSRDHYAGDRARPIAVCEPKILDRCLET